MPWQIKKGQGCPATRPWAVVKEGTNERVGCHPSQSSAQRQLAALYAMETHPMTEKRAPESQADKKEQEKPSLPHGYQPWLDVVSTDFEVRALEGKRPQFIGYAALFDAPSTSTILPYREEIAPGAFTRSLKNTKTHHGFVLDHDPNRLISSTRGGILQLGEDSRGLLVQSDLPDVSAANDLRGYYDADMVKGMSFTFKPKRTEQREGTVRRAEVLLGHVSAIVSPDLEVVYEQTEATMQMRALAETFEVEVVDIEDLFDGIRLGRALSEDEIGLLGQLAAHYNVPRLRTTEDWKALMQAKGIYPH